MIGGGILYKKRSFFRSQIILELFVDFMKVKCYNNATVMTVFC